MNSVKEEFMIIEDPDKKKDLDEIPDVDANGEPIFKIDTDEAGEDIEHITEESKFRGTSQDLKDETSQE